MIVCIYFINFIVSVSSNKAPQNDREIRNMMSDMLKEYEPKLRPRYLGSAVDVSVDATVLSISNIDEVSMVYTLDMFFRQRWKDERLAHLLKDNITLIMGTEHPSDVIWVPDTVFINSVSSKMHHVMVNNHKIDINHDGSVFWGTRVTVSPSCQLDLRSYPMDLQRCAFEIVSYAYTSRHVVYNWKGKGIHLDPHMPEMAQFKLTGYTTDKEEVQFVAGNYTVLSGTFHFQRLMGFAVMQVYIPTICVVIVSWISFWVKATVVPARVALLITTLLTISTVWGSVNAQLPRVNYVKAIDIFMMMSFGSIIMALVEFILVMNADVLSRKLGKYFPTYVPSSPEVTLRDACEKIKGQSSIRSSLLGIDNRYERNLCYKLKQRSPLLIAETEVKTDVNPTLSSTESVEWLANSIESTARILFPVCYFVFNLCYFAFYLGGEQ